MKLGLAMLPLHHPKVTCLDVSEQRREAILLADGLGYDEAWARAHDAWKA